jgi:hypothetical protein
MLDVDSSVLLSALAEYADWNKRGWSIMNIYGEKIELSVEVNRTYAVRGGCPRT